MYKTLMMQAVVTAATAVFFAATDGALAGAAALYGGGLAVVNALLLARGVSRAAALSGKGAHRGQLTLYLGALQRFLITLGVLALGLGVLQLAPIPLIVAFAAAQLGYLAQAFSRDKKTPDRV